ncbi:MAG: DUF2520 domain-containing protein [Chloroflexi bacterium]|nr:DUF2520 domain-containing protein [Chloroflexota bacterium]
MVRDRSFRVGFIGAGRAARALAVGLHGKGYQVSAVASRTPASAEALASHIRGCTPLKRPQDVAHSCDLVFITTPDDTIPSVAREVPWRKGMSVVHCSGAESLGVLEAAREQGASVGSFHPMQTFSGVPGEEASLSGVAFAVEGDSPLVDTLKEMANALGGWPVEIDPRDRPLYHLSGFLACGAVVTLLARSSELWEVMGYSREQGLDVLIPLLQSTVDSIKARGAAGALTGPISRGDIGTVRKHLDSLERQAPTVLPLYCQVALSTAALAREKGGIDDNRERELLDLLEERLARASRQFVS